MKHTFLYLDQSKGTLCCLLTALVIFFSCSKDESSNNNNEEISDLIGVLRDSEVEGVFYRVKDKTGKAVDSGYTDSEGKFKYKKGFKVEFYVNKNVFLGSVSEGKAEVTPIDLSDEANADENSDVVRRIAAFLQTLDEDGNPENGITIKKETREAIKEKIDFKRKDFRNKLEDLVDEVEKKRKKRLKIRGVEEAAQHLAKTLKKPYKTKDKVSAYFLKVFQNLEYGSEKMQWLHRANENGILTQSISRISQNKIFALYVHTYDPVNKIIKTTERKSASGSDVDQVGQEADPIDYVKYDWVYDADGKLKEYTKTDGNGVESKVTEIVIDETNQRIKTSKEKDDDGVSSVKTVKNYDEETGRLTSKEIRKADPNDPTKTTLLKVFHYSYNENGQLTKVELKDGKGILINSREITYDEQGKVTSRVKKDKGGKEVERNTRKKVADIYKQLEGKWFQYVRDEKQELNYMQFSNIEASGKPSEEAKGVLEINGLFGLTKASSTFTITKEEVTAPSIKSNPNAPKEEDRGFKAKYKILSANSLQLTIQLESSSEQTFTFKKG